MKKQKTKLNKLETFMFQSIIKKSNNNNLPFTPREKALLIWFAKFQLITIITASTWIMPVIEINNHIKEFKELKNQVRAVTPAHATTPSHTVQLARQNTNGGKTISDVKNPPKKSTAEVEKQIRQLAKDNNFQWEDYLIRLAYCENDTLTPGRRGDIDPRDRGVFQINSFWHPEVSDECAFDVKCATEWTMWRINSGYQYEWMCDALI